MKYVYILRAGRNQYKVGVAYNVQSRVASIQTGNASDVEIVCCRLAAKAEKVERDLHVFLGQYRTGRAREWFTLSPDQVIELVNPVVRGDGPLSRAVEGCLSLPGVAVEVERHRRVTVEYQTRHGEFRRLRCGGMQARAIQHEADHLEGVLIVDRAQGLAP